jgi:hypothetical protein
MTRRWGLVAGLCVWLASGLALAEGSAAFDVGDGTVGQANDQAVSKTTTMYVDIRSDQGQEKICWSGNGSLTVYRPDGTTFVGILNFISSCINASSGVTGAYVLKLSSDQNVGTKWDVRVCASSVSDANCLNVAANERTGRLWSYTWDFESNTDFREKYSNNGSVFAVVAGGAVGHDAVIEMQMRGVSGRNGQVLWIRI